MKLSTPLEGHFTVGYEFVHDGQTYKNHIKIPLLDEQFVQTWVVDNEYELLKKSLVKSLHCLGLSASYEDHH